jgi:hypothetical protein
VERGRVEVRRRDVPNEVRALSEGEAWSADELTAATNDAAVKEPATEDGAVVPPEGTAEPAGTSAAGVVTERESPGTTAGAARWEELAKERRYRDAYDALGPDGFTHTVASASPKKLFLLGEVARAAGRLREAARAFDALRTKHRGDGRAALAAFELGRLQLDSLGNAAAAAESFADAIALSPGAPFREDAEARRVQALERSGANLACVRARDDYLARYASGPHAPVVRRACRAK